MAAGAGTEPVNTKLDSHMLSASSSCCSHQSIIGTAAATTAPAATTAAAATAASCRSHPLAHALHVDDIVAAEVFLDVLIHVLPPRNQRLHQVAQVVLRQQPDALRSMPVCN